MSSLDSKINKVNNGIILSSDYCGGIINNSDFCLVDKYNTCDHNLTMRLKGSGKRQAGKFGFIEVVSHIFNFIFDWEIIVAIQNVKFFLFTFEYY